MNLVTGGTGLVGSHVLYELCKANIPVRALYRSKSSLDLVKKIFLHYDQNGEQLFNCIEWFEGDILDVISLEDAMQGINRVYHCAALVSFNKRHYADLMKINVEGTANIVNASLDANIEKLVYVSSTAAIGKGIENKMLTENDHWENGPDVSNYSLSKHLAEQEVWRGIEEGLNAAIINPSVILGPHDWNKGSTGAFKSIYNGLSFYTSGKNAVVDVRTVAEAMVMLMNSSINAQRYLVISENISIKELLSKMANGFGKKPPHREAGKFLAHVARILEAIKCRFTGKEPRITKETVTASFKQYAYSNDKLKQEFPSLNFHSANEAIENTVRFLKSTFIS